MNTNALRKLIVNQLEPITKIFSNITPYKTTLPYMNYYLNQIDLYYERNDCSLIIDVWSSKILEVEDIADKIIQKLNYQSCSNEKVIATFYLTNRNVINENDKNIHRRELRFNVIYYDKS